MDQKGRPCLIGSLVVPHGRVCDDHRLILRPGRFGLLHGTLGVDARSGVDLLMADRAAHPRRDGLGRRVIIARRHQGRLPGEFIPGALRMKPFRPEKVHEGIVRSEEGADEARTEIPPCRVGGVEGSARSAAPMSGRSDATLGDGGRGIDLSQRLPTQLDKGLARGGVGCAEVEDIGQDDEDRIAPLDVCGLLPRTSKRVGEQHGVTGGDRLAVGQGHDRPATATTLDLRDPFFARRESGHQGFPTSVCETISSLSSLGLRADVRTTRRWPGRRTEQ